MFSIFNSVKEKSHLEKELELLQNNLKEDYNTNRININLNMLKELLIKLKKWGKEPYLEDIFLEYADAFQLGELKTTNSDIKNLTKALSGNILLSYNKNIFTAAVTYIQEVKNNTEIDKEKLLEIVFHNSGWKNTNEEWYEFPIYINKKMYYIEVNTEKGYPIFNNAWDHDEEVKWVDKCDRSDFNIQLKNSDLISLVENNITLLNTLERFITEFNKSVHSFEKIDSEFKNEIDLVKEKQAELATLIKWLNSSFEMCNCFVASTLGLTNALIDFVKQVTRE